MVKFFCPTCEELTFSLRYLYAVNLPVKIQEWRKPKDEPQYCEKCKKQMPAKKCKTLDEIEKEAKK